MKTLYAVCLMFFAVGLCAAQEYEQAKRVAARAQTLAGDGEYDAARDTLHEGARRCGQGEEADRCRLYLYYSLGYLEQRQSVNDPSMAEMHLDRSASYYERVLQDQPDHGPTLNNLALVYASLGAGDRAATLLERAVRSDPKRAGQYALQLGDLQAELGDENAALRAYGEAARLSPQSKVPLRRMIDVYRSLPVERLGELRTLCKRWESRVPDVARDGYAAGMQLAARADAASAERFLLDWLRLEAEQQWLSSDSLRALPLKWAAPGAPELRAFVAKPREPDAWSGWWRRSVERRQTLGLAAVALARERLRRGDPKGADAYIEGGLSIAPEISDYLRDGPLRGRRVVRFDLLADLASMSYRFPDLEITLEFGEVEDRLFTGKSKAYRDLDLETILRFHTVLGLIYAERGVWGSPYQFRNGIFQLSRAISTARRIEKQTGFYQPQPHLMEALAGGYRAISREDEAARSFLDAAQAYLDTDRLRKTRQMLDIAAGSAEAPDRRRLAALKEITEFRTRLEHGAEWADVSPASTSFLYDEALDSAFLARQRFKILADRSTTEAPGEAVRALNSAIDKEFTLVGTADLLRLEKVQELTMTSLGPKSSVPLLTPQAAAEGLTGERLEIALPGESRPKVAVIEPDDVLAARIGRIVEPKRMWRTGDPQLVVEDGEVTYTADWQPSEAQIKAIEQIPGVNALRQQQRF